MPCTIIHKAKQPSQFGDDMAMLRAASLGTLARQYARMARTLEALERDTDELPERDGRRGQCRIEGDGHPGRDDQLDGQEAGSHDRRARRRE